MPKTRSIRRSSSSKNGVPKRVKRKLALARFAQRGEKMAMEGVQLAKEFELGENEETDMQRRAVKFQQAKLKNVQIARKILLQRRVQTALKTLSRKKEPSKLTTQIPPASETKKRFLREPAEPKPPRQSELPARPPRKPFRYSTRITPEIRQNIDMMEKWFERYSPDYKFTDKQMEEIIRIATKNANLPPEDFHEKFIEIVRRFVLI